MANQENIAPSKKDKNKIYFLLLVLLALLGTNTVLFLKNEKSQDEIVKLNDEKSIMKTEIDKIEDELDKASHDFEALNVQMKQQQEDARTKIAELREALRKGELTQKELRLAQEDVKQLRYFVKKYVVDIEELKQQNASLTTERDSLQSTVSTVSERARSLEKQNRDLDRKVKVAAALKTSSIIIKPVRIKSGGKESAVSKASTAQKLNINFKLMNNDIAEKGYHNVYIRIIDPKGNLIASDGKNIDLANGEDLQYSYKTAIEYANDGKLYNIGWTNPEVFQKGVYTVTLYADGFTTGTAKINLK